MRQIQGLESLSEEGASCLVPAHLVVVGSQELVSVVIVIAGSQKLRGGPRHGGLFVVIPGCPKVFCVKHQGHTMVKMQVGRALLQTR